MVKVRRNRQPRDWQNQTHERSHSGILRGAEVVKVSKLTVQDQLRKVRYNLKKLRKQIDKNKRKLNKAGHSPEEKAWLLQANAVLETKLTKTIISEMALADKEKIQQEQYLEHQKQVKEQEQIAAKRRQELKEAVPKYKTSASFNPGNGGKGRIVERIEKVGVHRRVKRVYQSGVKEPPQRNTGGGNVKVRNPNRKGTIFLPPKKKE